MALFWGAEVSHVARFGARVSTEEGTLDKSETT